jgi:hypothetical protein
MELWQKLLERYAVPADMAPEKRERIRLRICVFISNWLRSKVSGGERSAHTGGEGDGERRSVCTMVRDIRRLEPLDGIPETFVEES